MTAKPISEPGRCIVCWQAVATDNACKRRKVNTHPGRCRRLYHNYRMAIIRERDELARKWVVEWALTRKRQRDTKDTLVSRSANPASKGRRTPVRASGKKTPGGSLV